MNNWRGGCFRKGMKMFPRGVRWARRGMIFKFALFKKAPPLCSRKLEKLPRVGRQRQRPRTGQKMPMLETQQASLRRGVTRTRPLRAKWGLGTGENNETAGGRSV